MRLRGESRGTFKETCRTHITHLLQPVDLSVHPTPPWTGSRVRVPTKFHPTLKGPGCGAGRGSSRRGPGGASPPARTPSSSRGGGRSRRMPRLSSLSPAEPNTKTGSCQGRFLLLNHANVLSLLALVSFPGPRFPDPYCSHVCVLKPDLGRSDQSKSCARPTAAFLRFATQCWQCKHKPISPSDSPERTVLRSTHRVASHP